MNSSITKAIGAKANIVDALPAVTPIFQVSAFEAESEHFYTRKQNPNSLEFEMTVKTLEQADYAVSTTTGMAAINLTAELLQPGDVFVVSKFIYGCTLQYFIGLSERRGLVLELIDLTTEECWREIPSSTKMVFLETPTNPFLRTINLRKLRGYLDANSICSLVVVDNTWATPLYQKPLQHGADVSLHSATKFFSGHSDVMGGIILLNSEELYSRLSDLRFYTGAILPPFAAWLLRRSLYTLELRVKEHERKSKLMVDFLIDKAQVKKVYYPNIDGQQLTGYSGIIFFEFSDEYKNSYIEFRDSLKLFTSGTGMACVTSMIAQPYSGSHASLSTQQKAAMGIGEDLVRLCFGMESFEDLANDMDQALTRCSV